MYRNRANKKIHLPLPKHMNKKTFFITGVTSGLGRAFSQEALAAGHRVVGTVRQDEARAGFEALKPGEAFARVLDVRDYAAVEGAVADVEATVGPIDVLVNNAGYGHEGLVEESPMEELIQQFEVNVFGAVAAMKAVLPFMRQRRRGHILNITSMGGLMTFPGIAYYNGSKYALEGISGSLGKEVRPFGIFVTAVEPGMFRTDWAGRSMVRARRTIPDYDASFEPVRAARKSRDGNQPGDPAKAARAMLKLVDSPNPPTHLLLGPDALKFVREDRKAFDEEVAAWEAVSASTNFEA
jgi:NAD(P)-dependent dehydrogenase (short-subunit alcohol dehydrogenase family)